MEARLVEQGQLRAVTTGSVIVHALVVIEGQAWFVGQPEVMGVPLPRHLKLALMVRAAVIGSYSC
jgi:hypothetical protein